ncbi:MAG: WD40 repeat domain-containing protein [Chroococcales cyanobacterium]
MQDYIFVQSLDGHNQSVKTVSCSPNNQKIASGSNDKTIKIWDIETGESQTLIGHRETDWFGDVNSVAFSPNGKILASGSQDKTIKLWELDTGKIVRSVQLKKSIYSICFTPNGKTLVSSGDDTKITLIPLESLEM